MGLLDRLRGILRPRPRVERAATHVAAAEREGGSEAALDLLTSEGSVRLLPIGDALFESVRFALPFGAIRLPKPGEGARFGIVMKRGAIEVSAVKWQPPDCEARVGERLVDLHRVIIAHALPAYLNSGFAGLLLPVTYMRRKADGSTESGIAYFGRAAAQDVEPPDPDQEELRYVDDRFGVGFARMMMAFAKAAQESARQLGFPWQTAIGVEVRTRLQLEMVGFEFMALGRELICLKRGISEADPVWTTLRSRGVSALFHMPSVPMEIDEEK